MVYTKGILCQHQLLVTITIAAAVLYGISVVIRLTSAPISLGVGTRQGEGIRIPDIHLQNNEVGKFFSGFN